MGSAELCPSSVSPPQLKEALRPLLGIVESTSKTACLGIFFSDSTAAPLSRDKPTVHRQLAQEMLQDSLRVGDFARLCYAGGLVVTSL